MLGSRPRRALRDRDYGSAEDSELTNRANIRRRLFLVHLARNAASMAVAESGFFVLHNALTVGRRGAVQILTQKFCLNSEQTN